MSEEKDKVEGSRKRSEVDITPKPDLEVKNKEKKKQPKGRRKSKTKRELQKELEEYKQQLADSARFNEESDKEEKRKAEKKKQKDAKRMTKSQRKKERANKREIAWLQFKENIKWFFKNSLSILTALAVLVAISVTIKHLMTGDWIITLVGVVVMAAISAINHFIDR